MGIPRDKLRDILAAGDGIASLSQASVGTTSFTAAAREGKRRREKRRRGEEKRGRRLMFVPADKTEIMNGRSAPFSHVRRRQSARERASQVNDVEKWRRRRRSLRPKETPGQKRG